MSGWLLGALAWLGIGFAASWWWGSLARFGEEPEPRGGTVPRDDKGAAPCSEEDGLTRGVLPLTDVDSSTGGRLE